MGRRECVMRRMMSCVGGTRGVGLVVGPRNGGQDIMMTTHGACGGIGGPISRENTEGVRGIAMSKEWIAEEEMSGSMSGQISLAEMCQAHTLLRYAGPCGALTFAPLPPS